MGLFGKIFGGIIKGVASNASILLSVGGKRENLISFPLYMKKS